MVKKVLINMYLVGKVVKKAVWEMLVILLELFYSLTMTYLVGRGVIDYAYAVRGYKAYGGEYILILSAFVLSFYGIHIFFKLIRR